ncbi:MAG: hypothetical protein RMJ56_17275 [Gemmataceae bacterium]|nr:hypothetical protein [Gemmata sp.]MDW8199348.1 hypothetical protein [Gemmataceae bacterium]
MAAVIDPKELAAQYESRVDEQLAEATSRIRAHDLVFGGLLMVALVLVYATTMILLDKYLVLPEPVRQGALAAFLVVLAAVGYYTLIRPLRLRINPLYAARQVERTLDDNKNSVTGYVDAQLRGDLHPAVKAALANRAASAAAAADVNRAVDHRSLFYVGAAAVVLLLVLITLFFVFRPTQFGSLLGRAFVPFASDPIATRTQLTIVKPDPADLTITTGQSVTVAVYVGGKIPAANSPERVRLLLRHNPNDPNYEELPLVPGETSREWELRVPDYLIQNGFWYKVAGGDAETPEHRVTVRSLPLFTDFEVTYEYPAYLRRAPETASDPLIRGYRGTTVTLIARANRELRDGHMVIEPSKSGPITGNVVPGQPDRLRFQFQLTESARYKLTFTASNGETIAEPFVSTITVDNDQAPQVVITHPLEDEIELPANGQIVIDGKIGDDFGIDTVTLKLKVVGAAERPLLEQPYLNGNARSFRRERDDTWPTDLTYKGSIDLAQLKDPAGLDPKLKEGDILEFWLEATDNCTEPKPNVGRSAPKRVRLTPPKVEEAERNNLEQQKQQRQAEEQHHRQQQQQQLEKENRAAGRGSQQPNPTDPQKPDNNQPQPKTGDKTEPKTDNQPKEQQPNNPGNEPGQPSNDPNQRPKEQPPSSDVEKTAQELQNEIERSQNSAGEGKPHSAPPEEAREQPGEAKPRPGADQNLNKDRPAEPKPQPSEGRDTPAPAETKSHGETPKPQEPANTKPEPKASDPMTGPQNPAPAEPRSSPPATDAGTEKPQPQQPQPKDSSPQHDPKSGSCAKPSSNGEKNPGANDPASKAASQTKPPAQPPQPGQDKPTEADTPSGANQAHEKPQAGTGKPEKAPPPAEGNKPAPADSAGMDPSNTDSEPKPASGSNEAATAKPDDPKSPPAGDGVTPKGQDKPTTDATKGATNNAPQPKDKFTDQQKKELEQAARDLTSNDPQKRAEAQKKLDQAIGPEKRQELEQLARDLQSDDPQKRQAAQKKIDDLKKQLDGQSSNRPTNTEQPTLTDEQKKELAKALQDLQSSDEAKKQQARDKLDSMMGEQHRKDAEKLMNDLKSDDPQTRQAAQKKLEDMKKQLENAPKNQPTGNDPNRNRPTTDEEIAELMKKAEDLKSSDRDTRRQAEQALDEQIGPEARQELQRQLEKQPDKPLQPEQLKEQLEKWRQRPGAGTDAKGPMNDDPAHRLKAAELNLEKFQKEEYRKLLKEKKGWSDAEYDKFLKDYEQYIKNLRDEMTSGSAKPKSPLPYDPGQGITTGSGGKLTPTTPSAPGSAGIGGSTVAPPGFEDARRRFEEALKKKNK